MPGLQSTALIGQETMLLNDIHRTARQYECAEHEHEEETEREDGIHG